MRARVMGTAAVTAVAALGAFAAIGLGDDGPDSAARLFSAERTNQPIPVHQVATPSGNTSAVAAKTGKKTTIQYFESQPLTIPAGVNQERGGPLKCPKKTKVLSGYFGTEAPGATLDFSALGNNTREWVLAAYNTDAGPHTVIFGVVCAGNVG